MEVFKLSDLRCTYRRVRTGIDRGYWVSSCGHKLEAICKGFTYCPFCGKPIMKML